MPNKIGKLENIDGSTYIPIEKQSKGKKDPFAGRHKRERIQKKKAQRIARRRQR